MKIKMPDKSRLVKIMIAAVIGVLILMMLFWQSKSVYTSKNYYYPTETFVQLESGKPVTQVLSAPGNNPVLKSVAVTFATNARFNEGDVLVELLSGDTVLCDWHVDAGDLLDNAIREFDAEDGIRLSSDEVYTVRITETYEGEENNIAVGSASTGYLSCYMTTYDSGACLKWFFLMSALFIVGYVSLILWGGFIDGSVSKMIVAGLVSLLVIFILEFDFFPSVKTVLSVKPVPDSTGVWDTIEPGSSKTYSFSYYGDPFEDLELFTSGDNACDYEVTLVDNSTGTVYFDSVHVIPDWRVTTGRLCMMLQADKGASGLRYFEEGEYTLTVVNVSPDKSLSIELESTPAEGENGVVTFAGVRYSSLGVKVATLAVALMFAYIVVLNVVRNKWGLTAGKFFLVSVIPLSLLYLLMFQPWTVPDSGAHILASYRISNLLLGINGDREWMARACDASYYINIPWWSETNPTIEGVASMFHGLRIPAEDTTLVDILPHEDKMKYYSFISYLPQAIGLVLGRIIGVNAEWAMLLARVMILAAYIACCYRAVKNTPVGKIIFASLALLPISLMMSSSFSYDSMVIIAALSFTAIVLKLRSKITRGAIIEALIWAFILGAVKGGAGLIILPVALILVRKDKKSVVTMASVIGAALLSVLIFNKILPSDELFQFGEEGSGRMMTSFAYQNPVEYLRMIVRTYYCYADSFVAESFGHSLGYLEPTVSTLTSAGAVVAALVFSTFEKDEIELRKSDRILFTVITVLAFIIVPAMLMSYTPAGSGMVYGIQGRYFFQIMPVFMLAITKYGLHKSRVNADEKVRAASCNACVNVYVMFTVIMIYMMMKLYLGR